MAYRQVLTRQLNYSASLAKWLSIRLPTKWLWLQVPFQTLNFQSNFYIQATTECRSTLNPYVT